MLVSYNCHNPGQLYLFPDRVCDPGERAGSLPLPVPLRALQGRQEGVADGSRGFPASIDKNVARISRNHNGNQNEAVSDDRNRVRRFCCFSGHKRPSQRWSSRVAGDVRSDVMD